MLAALAAPPASAAPRMYLGFLDDESFRFDADRVGALDRAKAVDASVVRTIVQWNAVAERRPRDATNPFDPAYRFDDLDELVRHAQQRGIEVLLDVWGTPAWANGGRPPNVAPADPAELGRFAQAVARRYSGAFPGFPFARFFSIWNEPNNDRFLDAADPAETYAALAAAGVAGVRRGSRRALVAVGETSSRHAPARFLQAVARARPDLRFDAWAHHPYAPTAGGEPGDAAVWPDAGLPELARFGAAVDVAFGRARTALWLTEFATSASEVGARVPVDLRRAVELARRSDRTQMFVWLMLRNHVGEPWQSGVDDSPAADVFRRLALKLDPRNGRVELATGVRRHVLRVPALELRFHIPAAERVGVRYALRGCGRVLATAMPASRIGVDGWVDVPLSYRVKPGRHYSLIVEIEDVHGFTVRRTLDLVGAGRPHGSATCTRAS